MGEEEGGEEKGGQKRRGEKTGGEGRRGMWISCLRVRAPTDKKAIKLQSFTLLVSCFIYQNRFFCVLKNAKTVID